MPGHQGPGSMPVNSPVSTFSQSHGQEFIFCFGHNQRYSGDPMRCQGLNPGPLCAGQALSPILSPVMFFPSLLGTTLSVAKPSRALFPESGSYTNCHVEAEENKQGLQDTPHCETTARWSAASERTVCFTSWQSPRCQLTSLHFLANVRVGLSTKATLTSLFRRAHKLQQEVSQQEDKGAEVAFSRKQSCGGHY